MSARRRISVGCDVGDCSHLNQTIVTSREYGYDFIVTSLTGPKVTKSEQNGDGPQIDGICTDDVMPKSIISPEFRADLSMSSQDWSKIVVGQITDELDLDSDNEKFREESEACFLRELSYACHLGLPVIIVKLRSSNANLARVINAHLQEVACIQFIWLKVPMTDMGTPEEDSWHWWNRFSSMIETKPKIGLCLKLTPDLPDQFVIDRWLGEPLKASWIDTDVFLTNKAGFPVLPKTHHGIVQKFLKMNIQPVLSGHGIPAKDHKADYYFQYMEHVYQSIPPNDVYTQFSQGYDDFLQVPLQPLMDNLESQTYEVFEKDPAKYQAYLLAITLTLKDLCPDPEKDTQRLMVIVVGAGRGPLVEAALKASKATNVKTDIYALEKNPNAVITLKYRNMKEWDNKVTIIESDMRHWNPECKADLMISELLGSFGDNELSPECLDGAQRFLKPKTGVMIPQSYTSYVAPLQSFRLHTNASLNRDRWRHPEQPFEVPYVVKFSNVNVFCEPQPLFTFDHPRDMSLGKISNSKYDKLSFTAPYDVILHGFAGYFDCVLYNTVRMSILPQRHSKDMFSWFPMFFPIIHPVILQCGQKVEVHFWRVSNSSHVWYEWALTRPFPSPIHNVKGRSYKIGL